MAEDQQSPLADEAIRLLGAVQHWARENFPAPGPDGQLGSECQWCPLCQAMAVLRGDRPEVTERVTEAGTALLTAFRGLVDSTQHAHRPAPTPEPPAPRVQRIDLGDTDPGRPE